MSKEYSEALRTIKIKCHPNSNPSPLVDEAIDVIEKGLQRLEAIDNAKPSEALDKLLDRANHDEYLSRIGTEEAIKFLNENQMFVTSIKQALLKAQEMEKENDKLKGQVNYLTEVGTEYQKILKIIKEKNVDIALLKECKNESEYNIEVQCHNENLMKPLEWWIRGKLTKEEFELLKRWLD